MTKCVCVCMRLSVLCVFRRVLWMILSATVVSCAFCSCRCDCVCLYLCLRGVAVFMSEGTSACTHSVGDMVEADCKACDQVLVCMCVRACVRERLRRCFRCNVCRSAWVMCLSQHSWLRALIAELLHEAEQCEQAAASARVYLFLALLLAMSLSLRFCFPFTHTFLSHAQACEVLLPARLASGIRLITPGLRAEVDRLSALMQRVCSNSDAGKPTEYLLALSVTQLKQRNTGAG